MTESPTPSTSKCHDDKSDKSEKAVFLQIQDINCQVAQFRDLLINVGQPRDCPELREKIRKLRRSCVEACKGTSQLVLPQDMEKFYLRNSPTV
ncbi:regulator of G-protein signaling 7-binding protein [Vespula squamosa]|uniref:Regulator of G-protein signaling 7-binding protein n=1 Tax=Vespula squamosa TaxID=30214 RepID=A0ABD2C277_VESSQ